MIQEISVNRNHESRMDWLQLSAKGTCIDGLMMKLIKVAGYSFFLSNWKEFPKA